jgi:Fic/DOC family
MSLYWPAFEFAYSLDVRRLMPHIAAIEEYRQAALSPFVPPQWREQREQPALSNLGGETPTTKNPVQAQAWVRKRFGPGSPPLSLDEILTLHRVVAEESPGDYHSLVGVFRSDSVQVGRPEVGGMHVGAPPKRLPLLMGQYVGFVNSEESLSLHPVIHTLLAHFFFTTIHPFLDGNGRVSRLVATGILAQRGYNVHGGYYALSDYFYQNDIQYHTLLHRCWKQGVPFDVTAFVAFGMEGVVMELRSINSFIKMKLNRIIGAREIAKIARTARTAKIAKIENRVLAAN